MTKLKIDVINGALEVEGEEVFVKEIYQDFKEQLASLKSAPQKNHSQEIVLQSNNTFAEDLTLPDTLADLFGAISVSLTEVDVALVASGYIQEKNNLEKLSSQDINRELKHIGREIKNITRAINGNMGTKPQLMIQLKKSGSSRQARKEYKVTTEGLKAISLIMKREANA